MAGLKKMVEQTLYWCHRNAVELENKRIILGVSGGSDSVAMCYILSEIRKMKSLELHILHINHHLRDKSSKSDEVFTKSLAEKLNMPFIKHDLTPPDTSIEERCRDLRYETYRHYAEQLDADVFLAHTANDQAETLLFNLFRGTGPRGLSGMPVSRAIGDYKIFRPLIFSTRDELVNILNEIGETWREDVSNQDESFSRNYIRRLAIPPLVEKFGEQSINRILNTTLIQREYVETVEKSVSRFYKKLPYDIYLVLDKVRCYEHAGIFGEVIRQVLVDMGEGLAKFSDDLVKRLLEGDNANRVELFDEIYFEYYRNFSIIYRESITKELYYDSFIEEGVNQIGKFGQLELIRVDNDINISRDEGLFTAHFALEQECRLYIAMPEPGEVFTPLSSTERKFSQYARDRSIPRFLRNSVPVLCCDGMPIWAIGLGISNEFKVRPKNEICYKAVFHGDWKDLINNFKLNS